MCNLFPFTGLVYAAMKDCTLLLSLMCAIQLVTVESKTSCVQAIICISAKNVLHAFYEM